jgi:hypothetical protein
MRSNLSLQSRRPGLVVALVIGFMLTAWGGSLYSVGVQLGKPFPGFYYTPDHIVSSYTQRDFSGWEAGLRPWDRILAVDGRPFQEMPSLVQEAGIGGVLTYTVERDDRSFQVDVPTMEFTTDNLLEFLPFNVL